MSGSASRLEAVVLAAGEGTRLRPLTEHWPKALLPIDGRPVLATLLRELAGAGIQRTTVVVGHLGEQVERLLSSADFGLAVATARQERPHGSADALQAALAGGVRPPLLVVAADTVFRPGDLGAAASLFAASGAAGGLGVRSVRAPELAERSPVSVRDGRVAGIGEQPKPEGVDNRAAAAPLWLLREPLLRGLDGLPGPPFELAELVRRAIDSGEEVLALELGPTRDLTRPADVALQNFPYLWTWMVDRG